MQNMKGKTRTMKRKSVYRISRPDQMSAVESGVRQVILDVLLNGGPSSIKEIANALGKPADSLYYHIRMLSEVGLIIQVDSRKSGARDEAIYDVPTERFELVTDRRDPESTDATLRIMKNMTRVAARDCASGLESPKVVTKGKYRNFRGNRYIGRLTRDEIAELNEHLGRIEKLCKESAGRTSPNLVAITCIVSPIE